MGKVVSKVTEAVKDPIKSMSFGTLSTKKAKNTLFGKKVDPMSKILNPLDYKMKKQGLAGFRKGMRVLQGDLSRARKGVGVQQDIQSELKQAGAGAEDAKRRLAQLQAQRGMGGSSIGLGQLMGLEKGLAEKKGDIMASRARRIREGRTRAAQNLLAASQGAAAKTIDRKFTKGGRAGGIAPMLGTAVGAYFGGPAGAQLGGQIGGMAQQMASDRAAR